MQLALCLRKKNRTDKTRVVVILKVTQIPDWSCFHSGRKRPHIAKRHRQIDEEILCTTSHSL